VPTFPRGVGAKPRLVTPMRFPVAAQSWGQSGKGQVRALQNMGRVWQEVYPILDTKLATVRALIEALNRSLREGVLWDVQHPYWQQRLGSGAGSVTVNGGGQTGSNLTVSGGGGSGWLVAGDLVQVVGCAVVFDVTGNATATNIPISPPIFAGASPANGASVIHDPNSIIFKAYVVDVSEFPLIDAPRLMDAGLTVTFREQPQ